MQASTAWWIVAGLLVAAELTTGTIYLLMLAAAAAIGALAAHLGLPGSAQVALAAAAGALGTAGWYLHRRRHRQEPTAPRADRNLNLDIGETVSVDAWDAHGRAQVNYRGAAWSAQLAPGQAPRAGLHRIKSLNGNTLELEPLAD
jgi:membrane protein implicated in regulation of membrane protease activity